MDRQSRLPKKRREPTIYSIYSRGLLTKHVSLPYVTIGKNLQSTIEAYVKKDIEGRCIKEGFVKPDSTKIITFSSGIIERGNIINFNVVFECDICFPVEGMLISCVVTNVNKAGIQAASSDEQPSPIVVFIARDHSFNTKGFSDVKEGDKCTIRVIGQRFELNDGKVSIIAELVKPPSKEKQNQPKIVIEN